MSKLARAEQKIFAGSAGNNEIEQIGSLKNGSQVFTTDPVELQALSQFASGLLAIVSSDKYIPEITDINAIYFLITRQLAYLFQEGVPEYDATTNYFINSIVKGTGTNQLYYSLTDNNLGNALSSATYWTPYTGSSYLKYNVTLNSLDLMSGATIKARFFITTGTIATVSRFVEGATLTATTSVDAGGSAIT
jgi:hypothetical protein